MAVEGANTVAQRFHVWIRRGAESPGAFALRFEVLDGKGILRVTRPGLLSDPPARRTGLEERLTADQVRASRFLQVWDGGRYRQGHQLARLVDPRLASLPADRWVELLVEPHGKTPQLVLPADLGPESGEVDDESTAGAPPVECARTPEVHAPVAKLGAEPWRLQFKPRALGRPVAAPAPESPAPESPAPEPPAPESPAPATAELAGGAVLILDEPESPPDPVRPDPEPAAAAAAAPDTDAPPDPSVAMHERNTTLVRFLRREIASNRARIIALEAHVAKLESERTPRADP